MRGEIETMKKTLRTSMMVAFAILSLTLLAGCAIEDGGGYKNYDQSTIASISAILDRRMATATAPGAMVGIWEDGYETLLMAKGYADVAAKRPAVATDRFRIASNTKMFTAKAILLLADEGLLSLDDKVSKYLPSIANADQVTIRQLANHTSGYFNYTEDPGFAAAGAANPTRQWKPEEIFEYIKARPLEFTPGSTYKYSNTGYLLMGMIIEKVTGKKWTEYISSRITGQLSMLETTCPEGSAISGSYMKGYDVNNGVTSEVIVDPSMGWAAGGAVSTVPDMKKWLDGLAEGSLISNRMFTEQLKWVDDPASTGTVKYGFGLMCIKSKFIGHTGVIPGYNSAAFISFDKKKAIVVVFNNEENFQAGDAAFEIAKLIFQL